MTAEKWAKKIDYFTETINREVNAKKSKAKHQLANSLSQKVSARISAAEAKLQVQAAAEKRELAHSINRQISQMQFEEKNKFIDMRDRCIAQLFEDVRGDLRYFTQSPEYEPFLVEQINKAKESHDFAIVQIAPADMHMAEKINSATGLIVEEGDENYIGGFLLLTEDRKIRIDRTFKTRLAEIGASTHGAPWHR